MFGKSNYGQCGVAPKAMTGIEKVFEYMGMGNNNQSTVSTPVKVNLSNVVKVSCGMWHTCAITEDGKLYSWGWGHALGHKNIKRGRVVAEIVDVSCGERHTLMLTQDGRPFACGEGQHGRLGTGYIRTHKTPVFLEFFTQIKAKRVFAAKEFSFVLSQDGIPFGFGRNERIQLGTGGNLAADIYSCDSTPGEVSVDRIVDMSLSSNDVLCVDDEGNVYNWGDRVYLEPTKINEERFQDEKPSGKIIQTAVGNSFMMFLTDKGELFSCNKKTGIQSDIYTLGHGATNPFRIAKRVQALRSEFVVKVSASDTRVAVIVR
ncbi:regulator of chromosome condensation RCC1 [Reticulomyxa filosa]|uniref:Regulator of chromosome condensation RCC1 n=1 Tax=Reticulomyxa filosa TaxID=46433 RepID=X6MZS5_RETFI|nr:regulator of chromosome condensation RCC1 [Reticulomyxa filosa]|eukprot:ETO19311.1 regulator of chromosome condensation RCC1 [Reticulomyxa filosa]